MELSDTMQSCIESHKQAAIGQNRGQGRGRTSHVHNQPHNLDVTEVDNYEDGYLYTVDMGEIYKE